MNIQKQTTIAADASKIFSFLSNYLNIQDILPQEIEEYTANSAGFAFRISGMPMINFDLKEVVEDKKLVFYAEKGDLNFTLIFHIEQVTEFESEVTITLDANLTSVVRMIAENPLKSIIEQMVMKLAGKFN